MSELGAIAAAIAAVVGLWLWYVKRRKSPTKEERRDDLESELAGIERDLVEARRRGDHARADALLERLRDATIQVEHVGERAGREPGGHDVAGGHADPTAGPGIGGNGKPGARE